MPAFEFRWTDWNLAKIEKHRLSVADVESVVQNARRPFPKPIGNEKWLVTGARADGCWIQVIYLVDDDEGLFVLHARPLTTKERRRRRRGS